MDREIEAVATDYMFDKILDELETNGVSNPKEWGLAKIRLAKAALEAAEQAKWLPISEAPPAEVILVAIPFDEKSGGYYYHCAAYWGDKWRVAGTTTSRAPTHFQFLPTPPQENE